MPSDTRKLGVIAATSYFVGDIIGSGILVSPTSILKYSGSVGLALIVWTGCGLLSLLGTLCYIELGTSIPYSGGDFAYLCYYNWQPLASAFLWTYFLIYKPCTLAILVRTFGTYVVQAFSPLLQMSQEVQDSAVKLFGIALLLLLIWINFFQLTKYAAKIQVVVTTFKILSLSIIIVTGVVYMCEGNISNFYNAMDGSLVSANLVLAVNSGLWSFDGWDSLNFGVEELNNPKRTLFLSSFIGMTIVIVVYLGTNVAYFAVLGVDGMLNGTSEAVAQVFSQKVLGGFSYAIPAIVGVVIMGSVNSSVFTGSRYFYAAARKGHLPSYMKLLHVTQHTPQASLVTYAILAVIMTNVASVDDLINYVTFVVWLQRVFTISGFIWIRIKKWPLSDKAIKIPFFIHVIFFLCTLFLVIVQTYTAWQVTAIGCSVALMGLVIYFTLVWKTEKLPDPFKRIDYYVMKICQIVFYSVPEPLQLDTIGQISKTEDIQENHVTVEKF